MANTVYVYVCKPTELNPVGLHGGLVFSIPCLHNYTVPKFIQTNARSLFFPMVCCIIYILHPNSVVQYKEKLHYSVIKKKQRTYRAAIIIAVYYDHNVLWSIDIWWPLFFSHDYARVNTAYNTVQYVNVKKMIPDHNIIWHFVTLLHVAILCIIL